MSLFAMKMCYVRLFLRNIHFDFCSSSTSTMQQSSAIFLFINVSFVIYADLIIIFILEKRNRNMPIEIKRDEVTQHSSTAVSL